MGGGQVPYSFNQFRGWQGPAIWVGSEGDGVGRSGNVLLVYVDGG